MKNQYYARDQVAWDSLAGQARRKAGDATNCKDSYAILNDCFQQMNARHSFLMPVANTAVYDQDSTLAPRHPVWRQLVGEIRASLLPGNIGYLKVPWVSTSDPAISILVADSLQFLIEELDGKGISKWILDLRGNSGGNCWPMLAGIGPLLPDNLCGYFVFPDRKVPLLYRDGQASYGARVMCALDRPGYRLKSAQNYIAVLIGPGTSSSGETVALAFRGMPDVLFFGQPTAGYTTANTAYRLMDQSTLVLTVSREADRSGRICEGSIKPDQLITSPPEYEGQDPVRDEALMWLGIF
jgi:C-terminal processing protease CtpA/Prc